MSIILAIGRFFKKIWDWIKQTAWIQPLLIVGIIFGIIFSIRPIVEATKRSKQEKGEYNKFYTNYRLTLHGESETQKSEAGEFTTKLLDVIESGASEEAVSAFKSEYSDIVEDKFFLAYVAKECPVCDECRDGFVTFKNKINNAEGFYTVNKEEKFSMVTIFVDEEKYADTKSNESLFFEYSQNYGDLFGYAAGIAESSYYFQLANGISQSDIDSLGANDVEEFNTPTIMLVELNNPEVITEVMFGVEGGDKNDKAKTLYNCWEHKEKFSESQK